MIGSLRGTVLSLGASDVLLEVHGVGYRLVASSATVASLRAQEEVFFYIHEHIREDAHDLYGFRQASDHGLFKRLLNVDGVGPKVAMAILGVGDAETVQQAIMRGDLTALTSVPGVGKKTAQKIILELKGQLVDDETAAPGDAEVVDALVSLGYAAAQAREAVKAVPSTVTEVASRVREALKLLGK